VRSLAVLLVSLAAVVCCAEAGAAKARPGRIAVLEVPVLNAGTLRVLREGDFDVDRGPRPGVLRVYATDAEVGLLDRLGVD